MVQVRAVLFILGIILAGFAAAMVIPLLFDLDHGHRNWQAFGASAAITLFTAGLLIASGSSGRKLKFGTREGFLLTAVSWFAVSATGALPFCFSAGAARRLVYART